MDPYWSNAELCLELNTSVEIKYIKIYKIYLGYIEKINYTSMLGARGSVVG
jgi:hypothetical protein